MMNCRQVHHAILSSQDQALPWSQRLGVRLHLLMCHACRNFRQQMRLLRRASRALAGSEKNFF